MEHDDVKVDVVAVMDEAAECLALDFAKIAKAAYCIADEMLKARGARS